MTFTGALALAGWALFAASLDRATYNGYYATKGQIIGVLFNTITMFLILKNLIRIRKVVPGFISKGSLKAKLILFLLYQILLFVVILQMFSLISQTAKYMEYPMAFMTYFFYWSFVFDLRPKKRLAEEATLDWLYQIKFISKIYPCINEGC